METINKIQLKSASVYLENFEHGKGKITITTFNSKSYTYYWGAMGSDIETFILEINSDYFSRNLCNDYMVFSAKKSIQEVRRYIREEINYDLPWYKCLHGQKELRVILKEISNECESEHNFVDLMSNISNKIYEVDLKNWDDDEFLDIIKSHLENEPWNFIQKEYSAEYILLCKIHSELKKRIDK